MIKDYQKYEEIIAVWYLSVLYNFLEGSIVDHSYLNKIVQTRRSKYNQNIIALLGSIFYNPIALV